MKREQGPNTTLWWSFSRDHVFFYPADFEVGCCVLYRTRTRFFRALAGPYVRARPRTGAQTHPAPCSRAATPARQFCGWAPRLRHPANGVRTAHDPANETLLQAPGGRSHQGRRGVPVEARRRWEALRLDQEQRNAPERLLRCGLVWGLQATARPGGVRREQRGTSALDRRLGCDACARAADHLSACRPSSHEA